MNDDRSQPATKGDLLGLEEKCSGQLSGLKDELVETIRDGQTEILRAFYGFSQTVLDRFKV